MMEGERNDLVCSAGVLENKHDYVVLEPALLKRGVLTCDIFSKKLGI